MLTNRYICRGIGYEAALTLASFNPSRLILACRDVQKGADAVKSLSVTTFPNFINSLSLQGIKAANPNIKTNVECYRLDLTSFSSVRAFVTQFKESEEEGMEPRLDILIHNAAMVTFKFSKTADEWERTFVPGSLKLLVFNLLIFS